MISIIDTNMVTTKKLPALKVAGIETAIRYINPLNRSGVKTVKEPEARALARAGLRLGLVCEGWGGAENFSHGDITAETGKRDGEFCRDYARVVGAPDGACVYFAIDTDASASQIQHLVLPYFRAVGEAMSGSGLLVGVYGSGAVCTALQDADLVDLAWLSQSMGWTGSRAYRDSTMWALLQGPVTTIAGLDTDTNTANGMFGDFVPFGASEPPTPVPLPRPSPRHDAFWLQRRLNALGADPKLAIDGDVSFKTVKELEKYLPPE